MNQAKNVNIKVTRTSVYDVQDLLEEAREEDNAILLGMLNKIKKKSGRK